VDLKLPEFSVSSASEFVAGDLRDPKVAEAAVEGIDDVYRLAADIGGAW
jgi:GDP-D-mannose 3',5'-epimerase